MSCPIDAIPTLKLPWTSVPGRTYTIMSFIFLILMTGFVAGEVELSLKPLGESVTKPLGNSIVFTCEVTGDVRDGVSYNLQWFDRNNQEIIEKTGRMYVEEERGTMKKLYITNIEVNDEGTYRCAAVIDGRPHAKSVKLNLFKDITFDHAPSLQHPPINTDAMIECSVSGKPDPTVSWRYKGERVVFGDRYTEVTKKGIRVRNITQADDGEYTCRAEVEAEGRYNERKISVIVHIPPQITEGPGQTEGIEGEEAVLICKAKGLPSPKFEFIKDDSLSPLQSTSRILVDSDAGSIHFRPLIKNDEGKYICRVNNDVGSNMSEGHLKVLVKPVIQQFKSVVQTEGQSTILECLSSGDPAPEMTFRKTGRQTAYVMGENEDGRIIVQGAPGKLYLKISSLLPEDRSSYICSSRSRIGISEHTATVTVNFRPRFPNNHTDAVYIWAGKTRNITCRVESEPGPVISWMRSGRPLASNDTYRIFNMGKDSSLQVKVRESDQGWIYGNYTCHASNDLGSNEFAFELKRATVPAEPKSVSVVERQPNSIILDIDPPDDNGGERVTGYRVEYEEKMQEFTKVNISGNDSPDSMLTYTINNVTTTDVQGNKIVIEDLKPSTTYLLKVRAKNDVGVGHHLEHTVVTESTRKPYPIQILSSQEGEAFDYTVEWKRPNTGGFPIKEYEFKFRKVKVEAGTKNLTEIENWQSQSMSVGIDTPSVRFTLHKLEPSSIYQLEVRAKNNIGWSDANDQFTFITREATSRELEIRQGSVSFGVVIGVVIAVCILILVAIDLSCYFINGCGVTMTVCIHVCGKNKQFAKENEMEEGERQKLKDSLPDGKNELANNSKEEITLQEKDKLMNDIK